MNGSTVCVSDKGTSPKAERLAAPIIELLNGYDEIDLERLGGQPLVTFIQYDGIQLGDQLLLTWRGAKAAGEPVDHVGAVVEVEPPDFDPITQRMKVEIPNEFVVAVDQGYAFYSYERVTVNPEKPLRMSCWMKIETPNEFGVGVDQGYAFYSSERLTGDSEESLRTFCFVGVRRHRMEHMPVAQAFGGHALHIDPDTLGDECPFWAPVYQAMQVGDRITLYFNGYDEDGGSGYDYVDDYLVTDQNVGQSMGWEVPTSEFNWIEGGYAVVFYRIAFVGGGELDSAQQTYQIGPPPADPALLEAPSIQGYEGGELDPEQFTEGLVIRIPAYQQLHTADWTLLHVNDEPASAALRADLTTLVSGVQRIGLEARVLAGLTRLKLGYQVAREGLGLVSQKLDIEVLQPRNLSRVRVLDAHEEPPEPNLWLDAYEASSGAYVEVPDVHLRSGERLELHWQGRSNAGRSVQTLPAGSQLPYRFAIPATAVAANMEAYPGEERKRFPVFYRLISEAGNCIESPCVSLRILPLPRSRYPTIQCVEAVGNDLSRANVPERGATLNLPAWVFMAVGQKIRIVFGGVNESGRPLNVLLYDSDVTADDISRRAVSTTLSTTHLRQQAVGSNFTITVRLNFENENSDDTWFEFPELMLTLVP
jgi:hypothetical protein